MTTIQAGKQGFPKPQTHCKYTGIPQRLNLNIFILISKFQQAIQCLFSHLAYMYMYNNVPSDYANMYHHGINKLI